MIRYICTCCLILLSCVNAVADDSIPSGGSFSPFWRVDLRGGHPFPSYKDDILRDNLGDHKLVTADFYLADNIQYGFVLNPDTKQGRLYPGAWQGIGFGTVTFGNNYIFRSPFLIYAFQGAPIWRISRKLNLYYEWNFGASFGWKPYDSDTASGNLIVGSKVNAYINLGFGLQWRVSDCIDLMAGVDLTHFSNGNTSFPNPGVNAVAFRIGMTYSVSKALDEIYSGKSEAKTEAVEPTERSRRPEFDLTAYGAWRKRVYRGGETPVLLNGHFGVAGINFAPMWRIAPIFRAGVSADFQWDESTNLKKHHVTGDTSETIVFTRPPFFSQICAGVSARAELVMPIFSVNVGIGYNPLGPPETRSSYQLANLKVRITDGIFLNVGYQLRDFQKQNNLMLGLGYTFR